MLLENGNKILVVHRRLFEKDHSRFFVGAVQGYESGVAKVTGYAFGRDNISQNIVRKQEARTKLIGISSGALIVYCLPDEISVDDVTFFVAETGLQLKAPPNYTLNLSEWVHAH